MLGNRALGASLHGLDFNRHTPGHLARAVQEGVAFALAYGLEAMRELGLELARCAPPRGNLFLSDSLHPRRWRAPRGVALELRRTDGATGAALGAGFGAGLYPSWHDAVSHGARALVEACAAGARGLRARLMRAGARAGERNLEQELSDG